jgi:hypothetical protein
MRKFFQIAWETVRRVLHLWIYRNHLRSIVVDELPDSLQQRRLYIIGSDAPWAAAFLCPCGCGQVIHLSLLSDDSPSWSVSFNRDGLPTLFPSVWRTKGCRSHFFLKQGSIVWCQSEDVGTTQL